MAKEFGDFEDYSQDRGKGQQRPDSSLPHHDGDSGGFPREFFAKEVSQPIRSPREAYARCTEALSRIPDQTKQQAPRKTIDDLSKIYAMQGNGVEIRKLGEYLETTAYEDLIDDDAHQIPELGSTYWRAAYLGDAIAGQRLHELLQTEKNGAQLQEDTRTPRDSKLVSVVAACAENDVPADTWIAKYALNPDDRSGLKLKYWWESEKADTETRDTALRYREEITNQYLNDEGITKTYAFRHAEFLYGIQDDVEIKRKIFERFRELPRQMSDEGEQFDTGEFYHLCNFATRYLDDEGVARPEDVVWIENIVEEFSSGLNAAGHNPDTVSAFAQYAKDALDTYHEQDESKLIDKLDARTGEQELLNQEYGTHDDATSRREDRLYTLAKDALASEDINATKTYVAALGEDTAMNNASAKKLFDSIETMEQLEAIKPDAMELLFKENLATFFETKRILLGDNADELENLAASAMTTTVKRPRTINEHVQKYAIKRLYEIDADRGHEVTLALIDDTPDYNKVFEIAKNQIDSGDVTGWETMFKKIKPDDLSAYTKLALYAAKAMKSDETSIN